MTFDGSISIGDIVTAATIVFGLWAAVTKTYHRADKRAALFEQTVTQHTELLAAHSTRMEKNDETLLKVMSELQRLVGRLDSLNPQALSQAASIALEVVRTAEREALAKVAEAASEAARVLEPRRKTSRRRVGRRELDRT